MELGALFGWEGPCLKAGRSGGRCLEDSFDPSLQLDCASEPQCFAGSKLEEPQFRHTVQDRDLYDRSPADVDRRQAPWRNGVIECVPTAMTA
jgi:hypothetical protein